MTELLTKKELAARLKVSTRQVDRYRAAGFKLGEVKLGPRTIRYQWAVIVRKFKLQ